MAVTLSRVSAPLLNRYATPQAARTKFRAKVRTRIWKSFFIGREPSNVHHPAHAHLHADLVEGDGALALVLDVHAVTEDAFELEDEAGHARLSKSGLPGRTPHALTLPPA